MDTCVAVARAAGTLLMLAVLIGLGVAALRRAADVRHVVACAGWALLAVVVLAPAFHPWYLLWAVVPLAACTVDTRVRTGLAAVSAALCFLVLPDGFNLARDTAVPGALLDLAITAALVVYAVRWLRARSAAAPVVTPPTVESAR